MTATHLAAGALGLAALDLAGLALLAWQRARDRRTQAETLDDARHEFETGLAFLHGRLRRRDPLRKLPPIDDEGA